jgi:hypothetical protein
MGPALRRSGADGPAAVLFATDGGGTHPGLDPVQEGTIQADDLRLGSRVIGAPADTPLPEGLPVGRPLALSIGKAALDQAAVVFGLGLLAEGEACGPVEVEGRGEMLNAAWEAPGGGLRLAVPTDRAPPPRSRPPCKG